MPDEVCPLCEGQGSGLPVYFGTMADMFTVSRAMDVGSSRSSRENGKVPHRY